ncbi:MAG: LysE family transporter, partial [Myxococcota bacterium]
MSTIATVVVFYAIAAVSPGPNFIVITRTALAESRENGLYTGIGVATGTSLWAIVGAFGLGFLLTYVPWLTGALKLVGGLYLIYLG